MFESNNTLTRRKDILLFTYKLSLLNNLQNTCDLIWPWSCYRQIVAMQICFVAIKIKTLLKGIKDNFELLFN